MTIVVNFPANTDMKGFNTCKYRDRVFTKYFATNGKGKLACWAAFCSDDNKATAAQYLDDPQKFERDGISEYDFIKYQEDAKILFKKIERATKDGMFIAMIDRSSKNYNITEFKPLGSQRDHQATQDIGHNIDHLIQALKTRVHAFLDSNLSNETLQTKAESFLEEVGMIADIAYGCVSGDSENEAWKQRALIQDVELNQGFDMGTIAIGTGSSFSQSLSTAYESARKKLLGFLEECGFMLTIQKPKGQYWMVPGSCYIQLKPSKVAKQKRINALKTLVPAGLASRESSTDTELAAKMIRHGYDILKSSRDGRVDFNEVMHHLDQALLKLCPADYGKL